MWMPPRYWSTRVIIKRGVSFSSRDLHPQIRWSVGKVSAVTLEFTGRLAIITSAREGKHGRDSLHYEGRAIDYRTNDLRRHALVDYRDRVAAELGPDFDVVLELDDEHDRRNEHLHTEFDPKDGKARSYD